MLNIGEGLKRSPKYLEEMIYTSEDVKTLDDCKLSDRNQYREKLWEAVRNID